MGAPRDGPKPCSRALIQALQSICPSVGVSRALLQGSGNLCCSWLGSRLLWSRLTLRERGLAGISCRAV